MQDIKKGRPPGLPFCPVQPKPSAFRILEASPGAFLPVFLRLFDAGVARQQPILLEGLPQLRVYGEQGFGDRMPEGTRRAGGSAAADRALHVELCGVTRDLQATLDPASESTV